MTKFYYNKVINATVKMISANSTPEKLSIFINLNKKLRVKSSINQEVLGIQR